MANKAAKMPSLIYGTAWKKDATANLVKTALQSGFRAIDTAGQPKHYQEHLVGEGIRQALKENRTQLSRSDLYIQTKFTSIAGQDPANIPYDPQSSITDQVNASITSSLRNLQHTPEEESYIDCLVLHSPLPTPQQTQEAWRAMESHVPRRIRTLGISNCYHLPLLQDLYAFARVKPSVLQNRFYRDSDYDKAIRAFCAEKGITYQSFWTLTANPHLLRGEAVVAVTREVGISAPVALYCLVLGLGDVGVLNGTTNKDRMKEDLDGVEKVLKWKDENASAWKKIQDAFEAQLN